jgi:hypothetical protein
MAETSKAGYFGPLMVRASLWGVCAVVAAIFLAAFLASAAMSQRQRVYVPETGGTAQYKPTAIYLSGDSGDIWGIKRWLSYGGRTADAMATTSKNDCNPNCAEGHRTNATTRIRLSGIAVCGSVPAYSWLEVISTTNRSVAPVGRLQHLASVCPGARYPGPVIDLTSPSGNIACEVSGRRPGVRRPYADCETFKPPRSVTMNSDARARVCEGSRCLANTAVGPLVLAYRTAVTVGPFRCSSQTAGMRCVVRAGGHGFEISRQRVARF